METTLRLKLNLWWPRAAILLAIAVGLLLAGDLGIRWRRWVWDTTAPIRFLSDIDRGYAWGRLCANESFLNQYEKMQFQKPTDENWLDYAPLRLGAMALWGRWAVSHFPNVHRWHDDQSYALTAPILHFNLAMEAIGLVSAFCLTRVWANRRNPMPVSESLSYFFRGYVPGLAAALLLWFNPAIVLNAYGWPTWDLWVVAMYLLAALLASLDLWFVSGIVLGMGAMLKGQQLFAVPVFVIWSLVLGRPIWTLRLLVGVVTAAAMIASPWMLTYIPADQLAVARKAQAAFAQACQTPDGIFHLTRAFDFPALIWIACVLIATSAMPWVKWLRWKRQPAVAPSSATRMLESRWAWHWFAAMSVVLLVGWPWLLPRNRDNGWIGCLWVLALIVTVLSITPRGIFISTICTTAVAVLLCMSVFHGTSAWFDCGFRYGTVHWPRLNQGGSDNLPGILTSNFGWPNFQPKTPVFNIPTGLILRLPAHDISVSLSAMLLTLFWSTLILCSLGLGMHARRRDSRVLIALTAPWLMFFCFPPQMQERYLLYAAATSCICTGVSAGMTLLGMALSLATFIMTAFTLLAAAQTRGGIQQLGKNLENVFPAFFSEHAGEKLFSLAKGMHPELGYAIILCGLVFLYFSLALRERRISKPIMRGDSDARYGT